MTAVTFKKPEPVLSTGQRALRVVLVLPTYLPESFGGAEQQSRKLAFALDRLGVEVTLLAPQLLPATPRREQDGALVIHRFRVRHGPNLGGRHLLSWLSWSVKLLRWLARNRDDYDVIHVFHGRLHALPALLAGSWLHRPTLVKIGRGGKAHFDLDVLRRKKFFGRWYAQSTARHATAYVANSEEIAQDLHRWHILPGAIHRIPNGVDLPVLPAQRRAVDTVRFVSVGRLDREKSIDITIRGVARLEDRSRVRLTIVGEGECRAALEALVDELRLQDTVRFTGPVTDVAPLLLDADVFVSTSVSEGMSNSLLEAMSFALLPLVSRVSGVTDMVDDGSSGLLFAPGDLQAFVAKLQETVALTHAARAGIGLAARARVETHFGIDQVAARHVQVYRQLLATSG